MAVLGNQTFLMALTCGLFYFLKALTNVDSNLQLYIHDMKQIFVNVWIHGLIEPRNL